MLTCMSVCHSAIVARRTVAGSTSGSYISDSEDEMAFLRTAKQLGYRFFERGPNTINIKV